MWRDEIDPVWLAIGAIAAVVVVIVALDGPASGHSADPGAEIEHAAPPTTNPQR